MAIVAFCSIGAPDASPVRGWLVSPTDGVLWPLRRSLLVGRSPLRHLERTPERSCDLLVIDDPAASRVHAEFVVTIDGSITVVALGGAVQIDRSRESTPIADAGPLRTGDVVRLASSTFHLVASGPIAPAPVAVYPLTGALEAT